MESLIILSVRFDGKCKLISVTESSSFVDSVSTVIEKWVELREGQFSLVYSVGSVSNCCLESDDDLRNLIFFCIHSSAKIVNVDVCPKIPLKTHICATGSPVQNNVGENGSEQGYSYGKESDSMNVSVGGKRNECERGYSHENEFMDVSVGKKNKNVDVSPTNSYNGQQVEFVGELSVPFYDVCPYIKKKTMLSDEWADIMKGGVGLEFKGGAIEFRTELIKYSTQMGFKFKYTKNEARYIYAVCNESTDGKCGWFIKARRQSVTLYFEIYKANFIHNCVGKLVNDNSKRLGSAIMGKLVLQNVKSKPTISGREIVSVIKENYGIDISYTKAWRTIEASRNLIFGSYDESYDQLRWYCKAIERTNPGSVVSLEPNPETHHFERLFIAFKACIDGFRSCRPMLFIDGTFMKGRAKGTLLAATAKDGDNGLFPVAVAIVSAENTENWIWFLGKLRDFVHHEKQILFISDRNCGLMSAFPKVFQEPVHFYCLYHLLTNLKGRFSSGWSTNHRAKLGIHFKECAYAPNRRIFEEKIKIFKEVGGIIAEEWLDQLPYEKWAVAFSPHITRYGEMTSNAAESFNFWIREARALPITYMIDSIRLSISKWYVERRQASSLWSGALCPSKEEIWNNLTEIGRSWTVFECPHRDYQVESNPSVRVDLRTKTCSCYQWQVKGFPCSHAVAVIRKVSSSVFSHIEDCFFVKNYRECYKNDIYSIPDTERYECQSNDEQNKIFPPILKRSIGRPKKKRNKSYGEFKQKKTPKKYFCKGCCKMVSHDSVTCGVGVDKEAKD